MENVKGSIIHYTMFIVIILIAVLFIVVPVLLVGVPDKTDSRRLPYFALLGLGFMFMEITLINQFTLFLGYPIYSITVVLFSLLVFCGLGSYLSRYITRYKYGLPGAVGVAVTVLLLVTVFLPGLVDRFIGNSLIFKALIAILILSPVGFITGIPFPSALKKLNSDNSVPWSWGINGVFSIFAVNGAFFLVAILGYNWVLVLSALCYLLAFGFSFSFVPKNA